MTLFKRNKVYWAYWYTDGIRYQRSTGTPSRRQAEAVERKLREEYNARRFQLARYDPDLRFGELAARYLANAGPDSFYLSRLKQLLPFFSDLPVLRMTKGQVQEYRNGRKREKPNLTEATLNRDCAVVKHILYWAVDEGIISTNPLARLRLERERRIQRSILSVREELRLLDEAPAHLKPMIVTGLYTGLRRGELLAQRWEHIDFDRAVLGVTRSKTIGGQAREVPLAATVVESLLPLRQPEGNVFTFRGRAFSDFKNAWNPTVKRALARHFRFHDLRHTLNSRLAEVGVLQEIRKAIMGHSSGREVNSIYTHIEMPAKREAIRRLEEWVDRQKLLLTDTRP